MSLRVLVADGMGAEAAGITVKNTPRASSNAVAELVDIIMNF